MIFGLGVPLLFLDASSHLYNRLCLSVGCLVCQSGNTFVRQSAWCTLLAHLALFKNIEHITWPPISGKFGTL